MADHIQQLLVYIFLLLILVSKTSEFTKQQIIYSRAALIKN
jgi:hypothetical protein